MNILELQNVNKIYSEHKVLDNVSFKVKKGSIYGFVGENGAGKTTTMNIICGLTKASSGNIIFNGKELNYDDIRNDIGYLPQNPKFYEYMTVMEYANFILDICKINDSEIKEDLLKVVGLEKAVKKRVGGLSGGMKQRLGILASLCNNPKLLILDEPTSALDPEGRKDVMNIIKSLRDKGMTIFFSTHLLNDVENTCDYIIILDKGKIIKSCSMEELKNEHFSTYYEVKYKGSPQINELPDFINEMEHKDNSLIIKTKEELSSENDLYKFLLSLNIEIKSCIKKQVSLEEVFFDIVKGVKDNGV